MAKYANPKKRIEKKGLRRPATFTRDDFSLRKLQKWESKLQEMLTDHIVLNNEEEFLLNYSLAVCQFRLAIIDSRDSQPLLREIDRLENGGHNLGFQQEDLWAINRVFRDKERRELEEVYQILKTKTGAK